MLEQDDYVPIFIHGVSMLDGKQMCILVSVAKQNPDGTQDFVRNELVTTDYFKRRWPQMLIRFYETKTILNRESWSAPLATGLYPEINAVMERNEFFNYLLYFENDY